MMMMSHHSQGRFSASNSDGCSTIERICSAGPNANSCTLTICRQQLRATENQRK